MSQPDSFPFICPVYLSSRCSFSALYYSFPFRRIFRPIFIFCFVFRIIIFFGININFQFVVLLQVLKSLNPVNLISLLRVVRIARYTVLLLSPIVPADTGILKCIKRSCKCASVIINYRTEGPTDKVRTATVGLK